MKKVLVFLLACLSSTALLAQDPYYQPQNATGGTGNTMDITISVVLNGDILGEDDIQYELAVFTNNGNGVCRSTVYPGYWSTKKHTLTFGESLMGQSSDGLLSYKLYNHETGEELTDPIFTEEYPQLSYEDAASYGSTGHPWFVYFETSSPSGFTLDIIPYTAGEKDHYYLIASPVGAVQAQNVENLRSNAFDFYSFDQQAPVEDDGTTLEWINHGGEGGATYELQPGIGYLYANSGDGESEVVTLTFTGTGYEQTSVTIDLVNDGDTEWAGWNLVGNPFGGNADVSLPYYKMNGGGTDIMASTTEEPLAPMTGAFVQATAEATQVTFTPAPAGSKVTTLALNLSSKGDVIDRAIVSFGDKQQLRKLQLNSNSTKVYIPQDGTDYAVVSSEEMGEMPVNFKAEKSGSYTLAVSTELSFNYLHLIDNKTGADVDLLANPVYSFDAQTTDYASRFRLVFATGDSDDTFAFYSNGSFVISNEGDAVVQVMDVTGRMLSSEAISGSASINVDGAAGVYMLRLINGDNVKVQKVVVK